MTNLLTFARLRILGTLCTWLVCKPFPIPFGRPWTLRWRFMAWAWGWSYHNGSVQDYAEWRAWNTTEEGNGR